LDGALACAVIALPNFLWQVMNHFPFLELMHRVRMSSRDVVRGPVSFISDQAAILNPALFPLWAGGVLWLFVGQGHEKRRYRLLGWAFLVVLTTFIVLKAKNYYVAPIYPMLFAAGAIGLERITHGRRIGDWARIIYVALVIAVGALLLPFSAPVLSPEDYLRYQKTLGIQPPAVENQRNGPLPQWYADEFGWPEMVEKVARVYNSLPPEERARTAIFSNGWGEAAAVDFYGRSSACRWPSASTTVIGFGARGLRRKHVIILRSGGRDEPSLFESVESVVAWSILTARRDEYFDILLCRGLKKNLKDILARGEGVQHDLNWRSMTDHIPSSFTCPGLVGYSGIQRLPVCISVRVTATRESEPKIRTCDVSGLEIQNETAGLLRILPGTLPGSVYGAGSRPPTRPTSGSTTIGNHSP
jgi:hypothetical protein